MDEVLRISRVAKRFGGRAVLRDVNLSIKAGECVAVTGANGSGKSTLLRVAARLTPPSAGEVWVADGVEYVPDGFARIDMRLDAYLGYLARMGAGEARERALELGLGDAMGAKVRDFSKGMLSKLAAAGALLSGTRLLLLDEPVSGQDEPSRAMFVERVRAMRAEGTAVLLACHETGLIRALADRAYILLDGALDNYPLCDADAECLCASCGLFARGACVYGRGGAAR